jgi:AcrR family transcriptional regulator
MARPAKQPSATDAKEAPSLSRERIVDVALELISQKGLDDFSLRDVARSLEVYPTAIYWHIKNKNALLGEVCTLTLSKAVPPRGKSAWQDWLRALFRQYRKTMKQHPNLAQLVGARLLSNSDRNTDMIERILLVLEEAGCPDAHIVELYNTVIASIHDHGVRAAAQRGCGWMAFRIGRAGAPRLGHPIPEVGKALAGAGEQLVRPALANRARATDGCQLRELSGCVRVWPRKKDIGAEGSVQVGLARACPILRKPMIA